ncbi:hypothetical protein GCM10027592_53140 [Spirosoma flavus]
MGSSNNTFPDQGQLLYQITQDSQTGVLVLAPVLNEQSQLLNFQFAFLNTAGAKILGQNAEDLLGKRYTDHFAEGGGLVDVYRKVYETGQTAHLDQIPYDADGVKGWFNVKAVKHGEYTAITFVDITLLKEAEQHQQQQTAFLKQLLDTSPHGVIAYQAIRDHSASQPGAIIDFRTVFFNAAYERIFDQTAEIIHARTFRERFNDPAQAELFSFYVQHLETGQSFRRVRYYTHLKKWLDVTGTVMGDGFMLVISDITLYEQVQTDLKQQRELLQTTLDASISSILAMTAIRDEAGQIVDFRMDKANRAVERSLNKTPAELEGRTLLDVFPGNVENGFFALYAKTADTGTPSQATLHYTDLNGFDGWFDVSSVQQGPDKIVLTFMNVTEHKQLEQQLRDSNASLDQFAAVASHDLQEPLRKIKSYSDLLLQQYGTELGDGTAYLERMHSAANRMQGLIQSLLAYARLSQSELISFAMQDLNRIVQEVLTDLEYRLEETKATIMLDPLPMVLGDELQLRQVFLNLVSNALKFAKVGEPPTIRISCQSRKRAELGEDIQFSGKLYPGYWQLAVSDAGIGFDETYRERIFGAFERLHGISSPYSGSGMGLAIVRKVMQNHNGAVMAQGAPDAGATFTLYFPVTRL